MAIAWDEPTLTDADFIQDFKGADRSSESFTFKENIANQTNNNGTKNVKIMASLIYLSNFGELLKCP